MSKYNVNPFVQHRRQQERNQSTDVEIFHKVHSGPKLNIAVVEKLNRKRNSNLDLYKTSSVLKFENISYAEELISTHLSTKKRKIDIEPDDYLQYTEDENTGLFIFSLINTRDAIPYIKYKTNRNLLIRIHSYNVNDILNSEVRVSSDRNNIYIPDILMSSCTDDTIEKIVSMARLNAIEFTNVSTYLEISKRLFGENFDFTRFHKQLNSNLLEPLNESIAPIFQLDENVILTLGRSFLLALNYRWMNRKEENVQLFQMVVCIRLCVNILENSNPVVQGIVITPFLQWLKGDGCFDCALKIAKNYDIVPTYFLSPYIDQQNCIKIEGEITSTLVVCNDCRQLMTDPLSSREHAELLKTNKNIITLKPLGAHSFVTIGSTTDEIKLRMTGLLNEERVITLKIGEFKLFYDALDFMLQSIKTLHHKQGDCGMYRWMEKRRMGTIANSADLQTFVNNLIHLSLEDTKISQGALYIASFLIYRTIYDSKLHEISQLGVVKWLPELIKYIFFTNKDEETLAFIYLTRDVYMFRRTLIITPLSLFYKGQLKYKLNINLNMDEDDDDITQVLCSLASAYSIHKSGKQQINNAKPHQRELQVNELTAMKTDSNLIVTNNNGINNINQLPYHDVHTQTFPEPQFQNNYLYNSQPCNTYTPHLIQCPSMNQPMLVYDMPLVQNPNAQILPFYNPGLGVNPPDINIPHAITNVNVQYEQVMPYTTKSRFVMTEQNGTTFFTPIQ